MFGVNSLLSVKKQRFAAMALIFTVYASLSTAQASSNAPTSQSPVPYTICNNDDVIHNVEIDCTVVEGGFVIAPKKNSLQLVTDFQSAYMQFERIVSDLDEQIALIVGLNKPNELKALLDKNNILTLNMPTSAERQDMIGSGIRKAIKQINPNLPPVEVEKFVKQALERSIGETAISSFSESGLMQHELCHTWLNAYVHTLARGHKPLPQTYAAYGTPLPDWLDEAVAVSCEEESDKDRRMSDLRRARIGNMMMPFATFLQAQHPRNSRKAISKGESTSKSGGEVTVSVKINAPGSVSPTIAFYSQAYGVLNFLREISGRPDIARQIINAFAQSGDPLAAVLNSVRQEQKPLSLAELEQLWTQWLTSNARAASGAKVE